MLRNDCGSLRSKRLFSLGVKSTILCKDFYSTIKPLGIGSDVCLSAMAERQILLLFRGLTKKPAATSQHIFMFSFHIGIE